MHDIAPFWFLFSFSQNTPNPAFFCIFQKEYPNFNICYTMGDI